jgi:hypothetical protein
MDLYAPYRNCNVLFVQQCPFRVTRASWHAHSRVTADSAPRLLRIPQKNTHNYVQNVGVTTGDREGIIGSIKASRPGTAPGSGCLGGKLVQSQLVLHKPIPDWDIADLV